MTRPMTTAEAACYFRRLDRLGDSRKKWRRYFWAEHFIELGEWDAARHFVGLLWGQHDWNMPKTWEELADSIEGTPCPAR